MDKKTIDLFVLEFQQPKRIVLGEVTLDTLPKRADFIPAISKEELCTELGEQHTALSLAQTYIDGLVHTHRLCNKILKGRNEQEKGYKTIADYPFAYATADAYDFLKPEVAKEKKDDEKTIPIAHFSGDGIVILVKESSSSSFLLESAVHEQGHLLHWMLNPEEYNKSDPTMKEVLAIFTEFYCKVPVNYRPAQYDPVTKKGETSHYRAEQLLRNMAKMEAYRKMDSAARWDFLVSYTEHLELEKYIQAQQQDSIPKFLLPSSKHF